MEMKVALMKIVVIGGSGLIGSKLVTRLRAQGHEAVAASPNSGVNTFTRSQGCWPAPLGYGKVHRPSNIVYTRRDCPARLLPLRIAWPPGWPATLKTGCVSNKNSSTATS